MQRPYIDGISRKASHITRTNKHTKNDPLVFLSTLPENKVDRKLGYPESKDSIERKEEDPIKTILMKKPFMLIKGPGVQKVIEPKAMDINFLDNSKREDHVAPELGVLSMYDLKPWEAKHNEQNLLKLGKDYKSNLSYREAMEILDDSLTSNQGEP